ncbi:STAS/SEC14 domain-containing protein [Mycobacterium helveticum]|uniref:STAS/SEC14 domain-containing protein n=1 Tax=Mycobacterium helveticum TaxID=2592811 RepID=A0A557XMU7_9MYCO|nr:STAS/SEC14 domain-containing protein [Mycobacterium helveticum]TVS84484.1 STAS/SEC14 domain-containing protein [Mycobacterium helveticum]TVS87165.1 STAS/SEC14 domain-containing protein [Mycobacterium helveticum]
MCHGRVTKDDYDNVLIPEVEKRLEQHEKLQIYYEFAPDFDGIDPAAAWEDTRVGFSHILSWERIAVVADVEWIKQTMKFFGFLMPAELRAFSLAEAGEARKWITGTQAA